MLTFSKAFNGFVYSRQADGVSPHTESAYRWGILPLIKYLGDPCIDKITGEQLKEYFHYLRDETELAEPSLAQVWRVIKAFFTWAEKDLHLNRPDKDLVKPTGQGKEIHPYMEDEIKRLLKACMTTAPAQTDGRKSFTMKRPTAKRDRAMILLLLDTGARVSECARLVIKDINMETGEVRIRPFMSGIKSRARFVYLGKTTRKALWAYQVERGELNPEDPVFASKEGKPIDRHMIRKMLVSLGANAGVPDCHPHRFRHTMAIQYLRGGGDIFTLQRQLGHRSLIMVRHYLELADQDDQEMHRKASPVDRWHL